MPTHHRTDRIDPLVEAGWDDPAAFDDLDLDLDLADDDARLLGALPDWFGEDDDEPLDLDLLATSPLISRDWRLLP